MLSLSTIAMQIEHLHDRVLSAVQVNGRTVQNNISSIFSLEWIMSDALKKDDRKVSTGGRTIASLRFADDIDALVEEGQKLEALV